MGADSKIEWTHHTFNPWRGCTKVSAGCAHCYAETLSHRNPAVLGIWGDNGTRVVAAESAWREPLKWDRAAKIAGERHRVFCASLADVFEDRLDVRAPRLRLFNLIRQTPNLDWLLLTKRPQSVVNLIGQAARDCFSLDDDNPECDWLTDWLAGKSPANVWLGTSVEDQETADARIPHLLSVPAAVRFLSMEPFLGRVTLTRKVDIPACGDHPLMVGYTVTPDDGKSNLEKTRGEALAKSGINWVIVGGESGPGARPMHPAWARSIRDQCQAAGVPFFFKQWGEWGPCGAKGVEGRWIDGNGLSYSSGELMRGHDRQEVGLVFRVGKKVAGRTLAGRTWDAFPISIEGEEKVHA